MSYTKENLAKISSGGSRTTATLFSYNTSDDNMATIIASGYFLELAGEEEVKEGDFFFIKSSDANHLYKVTVVTSTDITFTLDENIWNTAVVTVSSAEILALRASPKTLIAAPGAGKAIRYLGATIRLIYGTAAYTESTDNMRVKYTDGSGVDVSELIEATGFITLTADSLTSSRPANDAIVAQSGAENQPLVLHNTGDGEYAAGDSTFAVYIDYQVINIA